MRCAVWTRTQADRNDNSPAGVVGPMNVARLTVCQVPGLLHRSVCVHFKRIIRYTSDITCSKTKEMCIYDETLLIFTQLLSLLGLSLWQL